MARRMLADSAIVAVGIMAGNVLSYGFSFALSHQLGSTGYGQIGALLALFLIASIPATALQAVTARRVATATAADGGQPGEQVAALAGPLIRWSVLVGLAEAVVLLVLSPRSRPRCPPSPPPRSAGRPSHCCPTPSSPATSGSLRAPAASPCSPRCSSR